MSRNVSGLVSEKDVSGGIPCDSVSGETADVRGHPPSVPRTTKTSYVRERVLIKMDGTLPRPVDDSSAHWDDTFKSSPLLFVIPISQPTKESGSLTMGT